MNKNNKNNKDNNLNININSNVKLNSNVNNINNSNINENNSISNVINNNTKQKNNNNETSPTNTIVKNVPNENNEAINKIKQYYKYSKEKILKVQSLIDETPILIKILNIVIPFTISYIFTKMYYNIYVSIFFAILTVCAILFMTKSIFYTILYLIFYIWLVTMATSDFYDIVGTPFEETDINKSGPFNCIGNYVQINNNRLLKSDSSGSFSYSYWININSTGINNPNIDKSSSKDNNWFNYRNKDWKLIFYRGNEMPNGITSLDVQYPGFWLTPILNNLVIVFQSNGNPVERIEIINIPLNTWVNISTVIERKSVSIYINGLLDRTLNLQQSSPDIGKNNIYIGENNANKNNNIGFPGFLAQLTYFNYALTPDAVYKGYNYNKEIIKKYENKIKNDYVISNLITNSDYYSNNETS